MLSSPSEGADARPPARYSSPRKRRLALRFRAYGKRRYVTLDVATEAEARKQAFAHILADVDRGIWQEPKAAAEVIEPSDNDPTFHQFASEWWAMKSGEIGPNTVLDYQWQIIEPSAALLRRAPALTDHRR